MLAYLFEYYLRPSLHWWGKPLPDWRWNFIVAAVAILAFLLRRSSLREMPQVRNPALGWLVALIVSALTVNLWAVDSSTSWDLTIALMKLLALYGVMIGVVRTQQGFDALAALHIAGAGWWGWQAYLDPHRLAGRLMNVGSSDTLNDNLAAAHLLTVVPFLCVYALTAKNKWLRILSLAAAPFIVNAFILCNSRGATVGLVAALLAGLMVARSGHRLRVAVAGVSVAVMFLVLADPQFIARQQTTTNYEAEGAERLQSWQGALHLIETHPFGAGGGGFVYLSPIYIPDIVASHNGEHRATHNTYLLIATDWGVQSLVLFCGFIGATLIVLRRVRQRSTGSDGFYYRSAAIHAALVGTLTAAIFSNRFTGESIYWMCAWAFALYRVQAAEASEAVPAGALRDGGAKPAVRPAASPVLADA